MAFRLAWAWLSLVSDEATNWQKPPKAAAAQPAGRAGKVGLLGPSHPLLISCSSSLSCWRQLCCCEKCCSLHNLHDGNGSGVAI